MEDVDDDFGDLYADVEVEASSAMNVAPQFSQLQRVSDDTDKQDLASKDNGNASSGGVENDEDDDDDDDDLDIVLNSDDDSVRHVDGFTIVRNNTNLRSRDLEDEDDNNLGTEEFMGGRSLGNSHSMYKYLRSQSSAYGSDLKGSGCTAAVYLAREDNAYYQQMGSRSMVPQRGDRFSLPRCRNILDVNIDIFEQKPWKHPGADITDYFNFGFNEDSWKLYCNQVDEYRHRVPALEPIHPIETKEYEGGFEHAMVAHDILGKSESGQRKGQAIQVEDSIVERQSSMDVRRQQNRDSDVIQVTIIDSFIPKASDHGGVYGGDCTDHLSFSSETESDEGNNLEMVIYSSKRSSPSKPASESHEVCQISNGSGGTDEAIKTSSNTKEMAGEEDTCTTESFKAEKSHKIDFKRNPGEKRFRERETSYLYNNRNYRDSKRKHHDDYPDDKRKHGDHRYHARCNSPVYNHGARKYAKPESLYENDIKPQEHKYRSVYKQRTRRIPKVEAYYEQDDSYSMSDIEGTYDLYSTFGHKKRYDYERLHDFDPYNEENIAYLKSKRPSVYYEDWHERYGTDVMDRSIFLEEDEYYGEPRRYIEDNKMMARDPYVKEREYYQRFINKGGDGKLFVEPEYYDDIREEKFTSLRYSGGERDDFEDGYDKHVANTRWKFRRNMSKVCSPVSELNNQAFASRSSEESHINNDRWQGNIMPRNCLHGRRGRFGGYDGSLGHYSQLFDRDNYTIDIDSRVEMQWEEDDAIFRHEDAKRCDDKASFHFEKVSRHKNLINNLQSLKGRKYKFTKTYGERHERSCRNLLDSRLIVEEVKSSERRKKPKLTDFDSCASDKVAQAVVTKAIDESLDIGEGQNLTKEVRMGPTKHDINKSRNQNRKTGFDNTRILEAMAKMEKRRTRFNEPITTTSKKNADCVMKQTVDLVQDTALSEQQRPARKRRWGGS